MSKGREKVIEEIKAKIISKLSDLDYERIKNQQKLAMVDPGTYRYKVFLHGDQIRLTVRKLKVEIEERLWAIKNGKSELARLEGQLSTGEIYDELPTNISDLHIKMNVYELKLHIELKERMIEAQAGSIINSLIQLAGHVGFHDPARNMILSEQEFEVYTNEIEKRVKGMGYEIFDDTIKNPDTNR